MADRNTIATSLSPEQLEGFNERCRTTKGLTLQKIADMAAEMGLEISVNSAKSYKETTFKRFLERVRASKETVETLAELTKDGQSPTGAALNITLQTMLERLVAGEGLTNEDLTCFAGVLNAAKKREEEGPKLAAQVQKLNAQIPLLNALVDQYKRKEDDWVEARARAKAKLEGIKAKGGLSKEALKQIEEAAAIL